MSPRSQAATISAVCISKSWTLSKIPAASKALVKLKCEVELKVVAIFSPAKSSILFIPELFLTTKASLLPNISWIQINLTGKLLAKATTPLVWPISAKSILPEEKAWFAATPESKNINSVSIPLSLKNLSK